MTTQHEVLWAYFGMLCLVAFGIAAGVLFTRVYYETHTCDTVHDINISTSKGDNK